MTHLKLSILLLIMPLVVACESAGTLAKESGKQSQGYSLEYLKGLVEINAFHQAYNTVKFEEPEKLKVALEKNNLWDLYNIREIKPFLIRNFPKNLEKLGVRNKKKIFLHGMLPILLVVYEEVQEQRRFLIKMIRRYPKQHRFDPLFFTEAKLLEREQAKLQYLVTHYKTDSIYLLGRRINVIPLSIALAQCAFESAWGQSRFATEGNNLFGVWTFRKKGMIPRFRKKGLSHKVAIYDSLVDSARDYLYKVNTHRAYYRFRSYRTQSKNPFKMISGLIHYSERKQAYLDDIVRMIKVNRLQRFDHLILEKSITTALLD